MPDPTGKIEAGDMATVTVHFTAYGAKPHPVSVMDVCDGVALIHGGGWLLTRMVEYNTYKVIAPSNGDGSETIMVPLDLLSKYSG